MTDIIMTTKNQIRNTLNELSASIEQQLETITIEESHAASDRVSKYMADLTADFDNDEFMADVKLMGLVGDISQRDEYLQTLSMDLMHCPCKYVVTDTKGIMNPAGFHPDTRVYKRTTIAIHTDTLRNMPTSNVQLYGHTIRA